MFGHFNDLILLGVAVRIQKVKLSVTTKLDQYGSPILFVPFDTLVF